MLSDAVKELGKAFLRVGQLLIDNQENGYWAATGAESFKDFTAMLGFSYSWATRLMAMHRVVTSQLLTEDEVLEIGQSKMGLLVAHTGNGGLTDEVKAIARDGSFIDLRKALGHNILDPELSEEYLVCPRCGEDVPIYPGMVKRR